MFETHFGFSAPPFQLNPDPTFYFGSKGHSNALAYLQYGVHQAEGFIVVTGDIGAGKTTLVRTLLEGLDSTQVKAAQIASTQLDATGLLQAMLTAFGVPHQPGAQSKASLISTLEAFFMTLAIKNKRALLVVDEAQNLSMDAIEELRMLSNFQLRKQALLQSFLVGQPELRGMLESQRLEQLRQRVIASCHLGPLDLDETRRYIEHRLNRVGWKGNPSFEDAAFPRIHQATGGIPRRINLLCNRLLLSAFLENLNRIDEDHIVRIARELRDEVGETTVAMAPVRPAEPRAQRVAEPRTVVPVPMPGPAEQPERSLALHRIARLDVQGERTVMCLVDSPASYFKAALLASALEQGESACRVVVVGCRTAQQLGPVENYAEAVDLPSLEVHLGVQSGGAARRTADSVLRFETLLDEFDPDAVVPLGLSDDLVSCVMLAIRRGIPSLRVDAGSLPPESFPGPRINADVLDRLSSVLYAPTRVASLALAQSGVPAHRIQVVGSVLLDGVAAAQTAGTLANALMAHHGLGSDFILVTSRVGEGRLAAASLSKLVLMLSRVRGERSMLWLVCGETQSALRAQGLGTVLSRSGIALASLPVFSAKLPILERASHLVTDAQDDLVEVAFALGKKVLLVDEEGQAPMVTDPAMAWLPLNATDLGPAQPPRDARNPDGGAAPAVARHLRGWLADPAGQASLRPEGAPAARLLSERA
ncbi:XrtA/PEP-CTERM system-associated ATPase [Rhizobacter sp. LjRoot28]|uniref:XrtA/PEP-CTERM system-associated ATPase n=1 Tax=Rhizobacter sp. LjRoot28 TaxID=3342309 RepID=UPI003ECE8DDA